MPPAKGDQAREMVETMRKKGDKDGADAWLRIIVADRRRPKVRRRDARLRQKAA